MSLIEGNALLLNAVSVDYGEGPVVHTLSLKAEAGEIVVLLGESGCGKSTTLRVVAGLVTPTAGSVHFGDEDVTQVPPWGRDVGLVFQQHALFPHLRVLENVMYGLRARRASRSSARDRAFEVLRLVHMDHLGSRYPRELSGGQAQRVALARALAPSPRVLLLDEPFSSLDANLRERMREEVVRIVRQVGVTTILVTHDQEEALSVGDRIAVMWSGRILEIGSPDDIYFRPRSGFTARFVGRSNVIEKRELKSESWLELSGNESGQAIAVKPEHVLIGAKAESLGEFRRPATLVSSSFHGPYAETVWRVSSLGDRLIRVRLPAGMGEALGNGDPSVIGWRHEHAIPVSVESEDQWE